VHETTSLPRLRTDVVVIGAGQAGLSAAYHLELPVYRPVRVTVVCECRCPDHRPSTPDHGPSAIRPALPAERVGL